MPTNQYYRVENPRERSRIQIIIVSFFLLHHPPVPRHNGMLRINRGYYVKRTTKSTMHCNVKIYEQRFLCRVIYFRCPETKINYKRNSKNDYATVNDTLKNEIVILYCCEHRRRHEESRVKIKGKWNPSTRRIQKSQRERAVWGWGSRKCWKLMTIIVRRFYDVEGEWNKGKKKNHT